MMHIAEYTAEHNVEQSKMQSRAAGEEHAGKQQLRRFEITAFGIDTCVGFQKAGVLFCLSVFEKELSMKKGTHSPCSGK